MPGLQNQGFKGSKQKGYFRNKKTGLPSDCGTVQNLEQWNLYSLQIRGQLRLLRKKAMIRRKAGREPNAGTGLAHS